MSSEIELKPCPFCGTSPEFDHYGTCYSLTCQECSCGPDIQISDLMSVEERQAMDFDIHAEGYGYPKEVLDRVVVELKSRWNTIPAKAEDNKGKGDS